MAKRTTPPEDSSGQVAFTVLSEDEARRLMADSRSGRGGRTSKYQPVLDAFKRLEQGKAIHLRLSKAEVQGIRQYLTKQVQADAKVVSSAVKGSEGQYHVLVIHGDPS